MNSSQPPEPPAYARHLLVCDGGNCADPATVRRLLQTLRRLLGEHGLDRSGNPHRVRFNLCDCLGVCAGGPIVVVYPEGIWYAGVDPALLARIVDEHLVGHQVLEEHCLHRLYPQGKEPAYPPQARGDGEEDPLYRLAEESAAQKAREGETAHEPLPDHVLAARARRRRRSQR